MLLHVQLPLVSGSQADLPARQFVRDPEGVVDGRLRDRLVRGARLPADARDTGYRLGGLQLWLAPSQSDGAYLRAGEDVERWPLADPMAACA